MGKDTNFSSFTVNLRGKITQFDRPVIMGILNISQDSFYDGGRHSDHTAMLQHAHALVEAGADIVDLGAVSTRPGAILPAEETEAKPKAPRGKKAAAKETVKKTVTRKKKSA